MSLKNIIGVDEVAKIVCLASGTVKNYCAQGKIKAKKIGKTWVIDKTDIWEDKNNGSRVE